MYVDSFPALTFNQFVQNFVNTLRTSTPLISDTSEGSIPLAFAEATAGNDIALQELIYSVYEIARLGTSTGPDVDSFVADYNLARNPATYANNLITLNRNNSSGVLTEPLGSIVQAPIGQVQFELIADVSQSSYDSANQVYFFADGQNSISVRVQALVAGRASNVPYNSISQIVSGLVGITSIINPKPFTNGNDVETDAELIARFQLYIQSLSKATKTAIEYAIDSVQPGLTYQIIEYMHPDFSPFVGGFSAIVDDGSGAISASVIQAIVAAIDMVRAAGIDRNVSPPINVDANISVKVTPVAGFALSSVQNAVVATVTTYINTLGVGVPVPLAGLSVVIQTCQISGLSCVAGYTNLSLNGKEADLNINLNQLARSGAISVTVN